MIKKHKTSTQNPYFPSTIFKCQKTHLKFAVTIYIERFPDTIDNIIWFKEFNRRININNKKQNTDQIKVNNNLVSN
jgi:flavin-binding protein dodecin